MTRDFRCDTPIDPASLRVKEVEIEGFKVLVNFGGTFHTNTIIRGMNGVGKTTLLNVLAGVAGNEAATELVADQPVKRLMVRLESGNREYVFTTKGRIDRQSVVDFKNSLPEDKRVNLAMSQFYYERYQAGAVDFSDFETSLYEFWDTGQRPMFFNTPMRGKLSTGSGGENAIRLLFLAAMRGGPLLLDLPEGSLDHRNKRRISRMILSEHKQTIVVTHAMEWGTGSEKIIDM